MQRFPGSGLLDGIKKRIAGVVGGLRSGWSSLSSGVQSAVGAVQGRVRAAMDGLGGLASSFVSGLQSAWGTVRSTAGKLADAAKQKLGGALAGVMRAAGAIKSALMNMDPGALQAAWQALKGVLGGAGQVVGAIGGAVGNQLKSLWTGLQSKASGGLQALQGKAGQLIGGIRSLASGVVDRISSGWDALSRRADGLSGVAGGAMRAIRSVVERLVSGGRQVWDGIKRQASGLKDRAAGAVEGAGKQLSGAWDTIKRRASGAFDGIKTAWNTVRTKATDTVGKLTGGLTGAIGKLKGFSIGGLIDKLTKWVPAIKKIKAAADDPDEAMRPMVDGVAGKLKAETPAKSQEVIGQKIAEASGGGAAKGQAGARPGARAATARGPVVARTPARGTVQIARYVEERSTASWSELGSGIWEAVKEKFAGVDVGKLVKDILWSLIWPWPGVIAEFKGMWDDWKKAAGTLFAPRNPLSDPLGCLHDLYSDLLKLIDFPMILWRRLNNIGMLLMGWVTIALVILGAVGGSVAGGVIGGIIGALAGLGIGAAPGGGAGAAGGGLAGAGAGLTAALAIGEALVISTVAAEGVTIIKALLELKTGRQTKEEKVDDYNQAANSALMLAIIGVLFAIGWLGSRIATAAARLFRKVFPKEKPPVQPPKTDPGTTEPPKKADPPKSSEPPKGMPPDVVARRATLKDPRAIEIFDNKFTKMVGDNPSADRLARFNNALDAMAKREGGDLEAALLKEWQKANPAAKDPFGSGAAKLPELRSKADGLIKEIEAYEKANPGRIKGIDRIRKKQQQDLDGVFSDMEKGKVEATDARVEGFENNHKGFRAEFEKAKEAPPGTEVGAKRGVYEIDQISPDGKRWVNVKDMNPFPKTDPRMAELIAQAKGNLAEAPKHPAPDGSIPEIVFDFKNGVDPGVAAELRGVTVDGRSPTVLGEPAKPPPPIVPRPPDDKEPE